MSLTREKRRSLQGLRLDDRLVSSLLSDEYARRILAVCIRQARPARDIARETALPPATVYRHVTRLRAVGLLVVERSALTPDGKRYELYRSRLRSARVEMDAAGVRVAWEPVEAVEERLVRLWDNLRE